MGIQRERCYLPYKVTFANRNEIWEGIMKSWKKEVSRKKDEQI